MKKLKLLLPALLILMVIGLGFTNSVNAQEPMPSDNEVNAIAKELFCPVCENTPLDVCPTQACAQWRELIRLKLSEGWTQEEIKQYFVDQYGARVLSEPPKTGLFWLVYVIPPILMIVGVYIFYKALRNMRSSAADLDEEPNTKVIEEDDYLSKIEEELKGLQDGK